MRILKKRLCFSLLIACVVLATGCSSHPSGKSSLNRGEQTLQTANPADVTPSGERPADHTDDIGNTGNAGNTGSNRESTAVTMEKAKEIALEKAGLTEQDGSWSKEKVDTDNGRTVYELEFVSNEIEHDFEIDAKSGDVLEYESESVYDES